MQLAELYTVSSEWLIGNVFALGTAIITLIVGWLAARALSQAIVTLLPNTRTVDKTVAPVLSQAVRYGILIIAIVIALSQLGVQTASILAVLGAAGLAIALALQGTLSNIAAGVMLIWLRPMSVGEYIEGGGIAGTVAELGLFGTKLNTADGVYIFVPNSQLWNASITNYSRAKRRRIDLKIGIAYDASIATARAELMKLSKDERILGDPEPIVYIESLGDSAVIIMLRVWVLTENYWDVLFDLTEKAKLAFDNKGIEIPFNKLDINVQQLPNIHTES
jgi:small conductance mechanosensitive channel